ncbi:MAG TPA: phospho-N-acetylmuramoyl-pentapeptide-transferase [Chroococcidiopsis sp.]
MDAKLTPDRGFGLSGKTLFITLATSLTGIAAGADLIFGHLPGFSPNLTLPFLVTTLAVSLLGYWVIPILRRLKAGQVIREDGPQAHLKKAGTPTMGGIFVVPTGVAIAMLWSGFSAPVMAVSLLTLAYGAIGWLDDWQILRRKSNKGISPRMKLALQVGFGALFCLWVIWAQPFSLTTLLLPLGISLPLGIAFFPLAWFALVAESNATNLTDGLDGLAGGTGAIALLGLGILVGPSHPDLMVFCAAMAGGYLGFLVHNHNPARVFMGDTGSLAMGGALAATAILSQALVPLLLLSGLFLAETLSVIAQVSYYKATKDENGIGKRLFKMAPLHHHLELTGWTETQVVGRFYLFGGALALACLIMFS